MKKSVVLSKIVDVLNNFDTVTMSNKLKAVVLLTEIESAGMVPNQWIWNELDEDGCPVVSSIPSMLEVIEEDNLGHIGWEKENA